MASTKSLNSSERPASPASSEGEGCVDLVFHISFYFVSFVQMAIADLAYLRFGLWLEVSTIGQILDYIVSSRQNGTEAILSFHWPASQVDDLFDS